jgi:sugar/nucleoside kinase (ribokinase family)
VNIDILTFGEALVEVMRTAIDQPLDRPAPFVGPYPSGAPFIFAVQAARLGMKSAAIGAVGDDWFGRCQLRQLEQDGVDLRGVRILPDYTTGVAFIAYAADGSREFVFHARHAAAGQLAPEMLDHADTAALFDGLRCLHIMGSALSISEGSYRLGLRALEMARAAGAKISFDPNIRPQLIAPEAARVQFAPFLEHADVLMPTDEEARILTGEDELDFAVARLFAMKPGRLLVLHRGREGSVVFQAHAGGIRADAVPPFAVEEVDPTGAGDCFAAGFLFRWLSGDTPAAAARFGNACGALAVTAQGPMAGIHRLDAVQRLLDGGAAADDR